MIALLFQGEVMLFLIILVAIIISLTFHEYGHAVTAKLFGDDTPEKQGRLTLNPVSHIDPMGLLMVAVIGFGFARPVQTNPANFRSRHADLFVSAAGPFMNLLIAVVAINFYLFGVANGWEFMAGSGSQRFFLFLAQINLILMLFNLIPLGPLDGHYILPHFLPPKTAQAYRYWNHQYGSHLMLGLVVLSLVGIPVFSYIWAVGDAMLPFIIFIR